jgi:hypothetical protein
MRCDVRSETRYSSNVYIDRGCSCSGKLWCACLVVALSPSSCQSDRSSTTLTSARRLALAPLPSAAVPRSSGPANAAPPASDQRVSPGSDAVDPITLLTVESSAYAATLRIDDQAIYLLSSTMVYRIVPGHAVESRPLDLSFGATLSWSSIVYWSKGGIYGAPKRGGKPRRRGTVNHQPQYFVASGDYLAWVDRTEQGVFTLQTLDGREPRIVYTAAGKIDAMTMLHDWIFFVERASDDSWRFGGISINGGRPSYTPDRRGRTPAMLVASTDIYYFDPDAEELRMLSPDFQRHETIATRLVCSPFAMSLDFFCAHVEGLFAVSRRSRQRRDLARSPHQPIASVAANSRYVAWVSDIGADRLAVNLLPLARTAEK